MSFGNLGPLGLLLYGPTIVTVVVSTAAIPYCVPYLAVITVTPADLFQLDKPLQPQGAYEPSWKVSVTKLNPTPGAYPIAEPTPVL